MANVRLPRTLALCRLAALPIDVLDQLFAACLAAAVARNDRLPSRGQITRFHSKQPPPLEITAYLARLTRYTPFPRDAVLLAIVYLNRISHLPYASEEGVHPSPLLPRVAPWRSPRSRAAALASPSSPTSPTSPSSLAPPTSPLRANAPIPPSPTISSVERPRTTPILNSYTLHRLVLAVLLVATKFTCDGTLSQARVAKVGGVSASELGKLEGEVIRLLGWGLYWGLEEMEDTMREVERIGVEKGIIEAVTREEEAEESTRTPTEQSFPMTSPPRPSPSLLETTPLLFRSTPPALSVPAPPSFSTSSTGALSSGPSSAAPSDYSASQPSSSASSPRLFSPTASLRGKRGSTYFTPQHAAGEEGEGEETPPSSPSVASAEGDDKDDVRSEEREEHRRGLSPKGSDETVRRLEGVSLAE
ncbi:hypothetical protein JCM8097_005181 [Rhodosporidiobolus ruineniae]